MTSEIPSSPRPLYSPESPILRTLLVVLVAGFVICRETFSRLFYTRGAAASLTPDDSIANLSHNTIQ